MPPHHALATLQSYATQRPDILARVPSDAMCILDAGCSNGSLGEMLRALVPGRRVLQQAVKYLKDGGVVIVSLPNVRHISAWNSIFIKGTFPRISRGIFDHTHLRWFTRRDAVALLESAGLSNIEITSNLRINDLPDTRLNRKIHQYSRHIEKWSLAREFLSYQFILKGTKEDGTHAK